MKIRILFALAPLALIFAHAESAEWPAPKAPVVPSADGYVAIPNAYVPPEKGRTYKAIFDATMRADKPEEILPALRMVGSQLNALGVAGVPLKNARFVAVFHGPAVDGILTNAAYKAKYNIDNPNLKVIAELRKAGVQLYVCGQHLASSNIDPKTLTPDVSIAADALIALITYQQAGYAILYY